MLPVLEDTGLAGRATEGTLTIRDLLLYSCLCGTGLDTIPLTGETTVEQIAALLLDLAAISVRLSKPLTARLMPIPGKKAGEEIRFDFEYFAASRVMVLPAKELKKVLHWGRTCLNPITEISRSGLTHRTCLKLIKIKFLAQSLYVLK